MLISSFVSSHSKEDKIFEGEGSVGGLLRYQYIPQPNFRENKFYLVIDAKSAHGNDVEVARRHELPLLKEIKIFTALSYSCSPFDASVREIVLKQLLLRHGGEVDFFHFVVRIGHST
jgi:hypothetical protein